MEELSGTRGGTHPMEVDETQKVVHSPIVPAPNIKPTTVFIDSDMLLRYLFFEWTVPMLNSGAPQRSLDKVIE